jgi:PAS domain S-box-containing protein
MSSVPLGQGKHFQFQHRLADGSLRMVETAASHIQFAGRGLLHSIIFDITERKRAEDALAEQRKLLANVIEGTNVGTWRWQVLTGEALFNERWAQIMGYTLAELGVISVQTWLDLTHPDDLKKSEELLHQHFTGKLDYYDYECRMKHKNGTWVWVHDRGKVVEWSPEGKPLVMTGTHSDISERKRVEEALQKAKDEANAATRSKSQFLANMSHEIRTPMNAILGFSSLLTNTQLTEKQARHLNTIQSNGKLLLEIINDILDVSKFESGNMSLESIDFNLDYLCRDVLEMCLSKIEGKPIETYVRIEHDVPVNLKGDPTRLRQVLVNLLGNAMKFTMNGSIGIKVLTDKEGQANGIVALRVHVIDTGIGIPQDKADMIFQPFTQVDESTTRKFGGTGLGLSISKAIVTAYGGKIWVESKEGKGSEFIFTLKLKAGDQSSTVGIQPLPFDKLKGKRVVIVDDKVVNRDLLQYYCEGAGMLISGVYEKPALAVDEIRLMCGGNDAPDIVLSDLMMPEMDGHQLAQSIKQIRDIKLVVVTSDARIGTAKEAESYGFDGYIAKPFAREQFYKVLATVLGDMREDGPIVTRHMAEELSCKGVKILVAEDNIANRMLMEEYLQMLECEYDFVVNGQEAVEKLRGKDYDLCLMDVQMPVMDGLAATQIIRQEISKDFPVIALSAAVMQEDKEKGSAAGMTDYLNKPVSLQDLKAVIVKWKDGGTKENT